MDTKLCNDNGTRCDEGTNLGLQFDKASVAHARCLTGLCHCVSLFHSFNMISFWAYLSLINFSLFVEPLCVGITKNPMEAMWSLKTNLTTESITVEPDGVHDYDHPNFDPDFTPEMLTNGFISYTKECVEEKAKKGSGE